MKHFISVNDVRVQIERLCDRYEICAADRIYGVPRGGVPIALAVCCLSGAKLVSDVKDANFVVDDILDSGRTKQRILDSLDHNPQFIAAFNKQTEAFKGKWLVMPWEIAEQHDHSAEDAIVRLLQHIGEDPDREGLRETPARVIRAWKEWASGYGQKPEDVLKTFVDGANGVDEMVIVHNVPVFSRCEHHLSDIHGVAHVGYIPNGKIVGLSKLARVVEIFARRLQVQEHMTVQIADALSDHLQPRGIGVLIRCAHHCMSTRGVKVHGSVTTTSAMRGLLLESGNTRAEFLELCRAAELDR